MVYVIVEIQEAKLKALLLHIVVLPRVSCYITFTPTEYDSTQYISVIISPPETNFIQA